MEQAVYTMEDVMVILKCGKTKAYEVIKYLNGELKKMNYMVIPGRVPSKFFNERLHL